MQSLGRASGSGSRLENRQSREDLASYPNRVSLNDAERRQERIRGGGTYFEIDRYPNTRTDPIVEPDDFFGGVEGKLGMIGEDEVVFLGDDVFGGHLIK